MSATIQDFAAEFAKVADKWDITIGTVNYSRDDTNYKFENVHYVPDNFTITLNGINCDKFQMHEMAMRALKALEAGRSFSDGIPEPGNYTPAPSPYHEYGNPLKETKAGLDLLSNFATRCLNFMDNNGEWPNVCGYPRTSDPALTTYNGYVCLERNLLMLSRLFRYMVQNNVTDLNAIANIEISTYLWGETGTNFSSNVTWTSGSDSAYDQTAYVNGSEEIPVLKLGTSTKYGKSTLTLPAGSKKLSFYAVSWNNADAANLVFTVNGTQVATVTPKANSGLKSNAPYTLTVDDNDYYTINLGSRTAEVTVETSGYGCRAAIFAIVAE